jgi:hypothetical protein
MQKDGVMAYFEELFLHTPGWTAVNHKNPGSEYLGF